MDGELAVYADEKKGGEQMIETKTELTKEEKIKLGLIRPYSVVADRMIIEDIEKGFTAEKIAKIYNRDVDDLKEHIEKIKGKVKSRRFEGQDDNFKDLYAAIFKQAAREDIAKAKVMVYDALHKNGINRKEVDEFVNAEVEAVVRKLVLKEALRYPKRR